MLKIITKKERELLAQKKLNYEKEAGFFKHLTIKNYEKTFRKGILKLCRRRFDVWLTSLSSQK